MKLYDFYNRNFPMYHLCERVNINSSKFKVTGCQKGIEPLDVLKSILGRDINGKERYLEVQEIKYRNHQGIFKNPENGINSFFEAVCEEKSVLIPEDVETIGGF